MRWRPAALLLLALLAGCAPALRYRSAPLPQGRSVDDLLVEGMNARVLSDLFARRIVAEVDWVEGFTPSDAALSLLEDELRRAAAPGLDVEVRRGDEIPRAEWEAAREPDTRAAFLARHVPPAVPDVEPLWVLYQPDARRWLGDLGTEIFGLAYPTALLDEAQPRIVPTVHLFTDTFRSRTPLWITPQDAERATMVHELGHVLGLVSNPTHVQRDNPHHCTGPDCTMPGPRPKTILYNAPRAFFTGRVPESYCARCRADLARARELYAARRDEPGFRERLARSQRRARAMSVLDWSVFLGREALAVRTLDELSAEPIDDDLRWRVVLLEVGFGRWDRVLQLTSVEDVPTGFLQVRMAALMNTGAFDEAERLAGAQHDCSWFAQERARAMDAAGRTEDALRHLRQRAGACRQTSTWMLATASELLVRSGRLEEALIFTQGLPQARITRAIAMLGLGRRPFAEVILRDFVNDQQRIFRDEPRLWSAQRLAGAYALLGDADGLEAVVERARVLWGTAGATEVGGYASAHLGDADAAIAGLESARRFGRLPRDACFDLAWDSVRDDPRFRALYPGCPPRRASTASRSSSSGSAARAQGRSTSRNPAAASRSRMAAIGCAHSTIVWLTRS